MRTEGSFEYRNEAKKLLLNLINDVPKSTNSITREFKKTISKVHYYTVERILKKLRDEGKITCMKIGRITVWKRV